MRMEPSEGKHAARMSVVADGSDVSNVASAIEVLEDDVVIDLRRHPPILTLGEVTLILDDSTPPAQSRAGVRALDLAIAIPALIVFSPVMAGIAALVAVSSKGPVLYRSSRQTRNGEEFGMLKFRTMVVDADEVLEQYLADDPSARELFERHNKFKRDPRVTRVGRVLRSLSLDELPQLVNVIRGEMSIVGPRPQLHWEAERFGSALATVHRVKGGITGLWQVSGRSDVTFEQRMVMDVDYALRRNAKLDLRILARTIGQLLKGSPGAY